MAKTKKQKLMIIGCLGGTNKEDILKWMDSTFYGRSRAVSCLTEQIKWQGNDPILKKIVDGTMLFSFE